MKRDLWLIWSLALLSVLAAVARADTSTTGGARVVENPTVDGDLKLRVHDSSPDARVDALTITGSTQTITVGSSSNATIKAAGSNNDLNLEAVGSGGAIVFKANGAERGRIDQLGRWNVKRLIYTVNSQAADGSIDSNTSTYVLITSGSTTSILTDGEVEGQYLILVNNGGSTFTLTRTGSLLTITGADLSLANRTVVTFIWSATIGRWLQISAVAAVT